MMNPPASEKIRTYFDVDSYYIATKEKNPGERYMRFAFTGKISIEKKSMTYNEIQHRRSKFTEYDPMYIKGEIPTNCTLFMAYCTEEGDCRIYKTREELAEKESERSYNSCLEALIDYYTDSKYVVLSYDSKGKTVVTDSGNNIVNMPYKKFVEKAKEMISSSSSDSSVSSASFIEVIKEFTTHDGAKIPEELIPFTRDNWKKCFMTYSYIDNFFNWNATVIYRLTFNDNYPNGLLTTDLEDKVFQVV